MDRQSEGRRPVQCREGDGTPSCSHPVAQCQGRAVGRWAGLGDQVWVWTVLPSMFCLGEPAERVRVQERW